MNFETKTRIYLLSLLMMIFFVLNLTVGSISIPFHKIIGIMLNLEIENKTWVYIVEKIRLPKAFVAILAGSALSVSGLQMQTLFRNSLAGPGILGITAGASLGVAFFMLISNNISNTALHLSMTGSGILILSSIIGAVSVIGLMLFIAWRTRNNTVLLIIGLMIGYTIFSIISIWQYFSHPEQLKNYVIWTFGSLGGINNTLQLFFLSIIIGMGILFSFWISKALNLLLLGENYAQSMGLSIKKIRWKIILITAILTGSITAFCGPISFVGIAVPHLSRILFHTADHGILTIGCFLIGSVTMLLCEACTHLPGNSIILPINTITALLGSPVVIWILLRNASKYAL